jgi:hypothetical protein
MSKEFWKSLVSTYAEYRDVENNIHKMMENHQSLHNFLRTYANLRAGLWTTLMKHFLEVPRQKC